MFNTEECPWCSLQWREMGRRGVRSRYHYDNKHVGAVFREGTEEDGEYKCASPLLPWVGHNSPMSSIFLLLISGTTNLLKQDTLQQLRIPVEKNKSYCISFNYYLGCEVFQLSKRNCYWHMFFFFIAFY